MIRKPALGHGGAAAIVSAALALEGCNVLFGIESAELPDEQGQAGSPPVEGQGGAAGDSSGSSGSSGGAGGEGGTLMPLRATQIAAGEYHVCAVTNGGEVYCWGKNDRGQLGDHTTSTRSLPKPVLREDGTLLAGAQALALNKDSCALVNNGGVSEVYCWGANESGQLGDGNTEGAHHFAKPVLLDGTAGPLIGVKGIGLGDSHGCALLTSDEVYCWGNNDVNQLGDGTKYSHPAARPVLLDGSGLPLKGAQAIAVGDTHTCALMSDYQVRCWGSNDRNRLGVGGATGNYPYPTTVLNTSSPDDSLKDVKALALGSRHSCAFMIDTSVRCWGDNLLGQIGDGTITEATFPTPVRLGKDSPQLLGATAIDAGSYYGCALMNGGGIHCWGDNRWAQLGDGSIMANNSPKPVQLGTLLGALMGAQAVTTGDHHSCAILQEGDVSCWGDDLSMPHDGQPRNLHHYPTPIMH